MKNIPTFLKWAGGKRRILDKLEPLFPQQIERYFEPFLGGGSVFFFVRQKFDPSYSMISDVNLNLISTYRDVRDNPKQLLRALRKFKLRDSSDYYYDVRVAFNAQKITGVERSAAFIYMNKTCYSGLYRVNSRNEFNVPYGKYKNAEIFDEDTIERASELLQGVHIECQDYRNIVKHVGSDDFVYLDPCYDPKTKTSFVQYTPERFSDSDRENLADFVLQVQQRGAKVLLSNNNLARVRELYQHPGFTLHKITAPRSLGARVGAKSKVVELAIRNYVSVP
ncbi:MAG: DNA adenine methylase [Minisyncoccota bacterium]